ncbi:MAG: transposase [Chloroflexi bacterium]|nr:transposase [Chloroflexota bacterium]
MKKIFRESLKTKHSYIEINSGSEVFLTHCEVVPMQNLFLLKFQIVQNFAGHFIIIPVSYNSPHAGSMGKKRCMGGEMNFGRLRDWISGNHFIKKRLHLVALLYVVCLMMPARKHTIEAAARLCGSTRSRFSKFLQNHSDTAIWSMKDLSKKQAKQFSKVMQSLCSNQLPWNIAIIVDSTFQERSTLHTDNSKRFNHGKGYVIGHQWTNIVLMINDRLIPLLPIPFYSKKYCRQNKLTYKTENLRVTEYFSGLDIHEYVGPHDPGKVVVLADSAYDDKKIEHAVSRKKWKFVISSKSTRTFKTEKQFLNTPKSKSWLSVSEFFRINRWIKWLTVRIERNGGTKKRMEFRIRHVTGILRNYGKVRLICSEFKKRPKGRRKYLISNDLKAEPRQIVIGYRLRWMIEIFHKEVKMFLGFEDVSPSWFKSSVSHVHWVYCAYILLKYRMVENGIPPKSMAECQIMAKRSLEEKNLLRQKQLLTRFDGVKKLKGLIQEAIEEDREVGIFDYQALVIA